jgi:GNAT superfamily N-acetyltransferase
VRSADDDRVLDRCLRNLRVLHHLLGAHAGRLVDVEGVVGSLFGLSDDRTVLSAVVVPHAVPIAPLVAAVQRRHGDTGAAFWVDPRDARAAAGAGLEKQLTVPAMELPLTSMHAGSDAVERIDPGTAGAVNDLAYGFRDGRLAKALGSLPPSRVRAYGERGSDGRIVCAALALDVDDDCLVEYVATDPRHQRHGRATRLLRHLLAEAATAGSRRAALRTSAAGASLYAKAGFGVVAQLSVWRPRPA